MAALSADRTTPQMDREVFPHRLAFPIADAVILYTGAIAMLDTAGRAKPGAASTTAKCAGISWKQYDNTVQGHTAGGITGEFLQGVFRVDNSTAGEALAAADVGNLCYVVDDHTVGKSSAGGTLIVAGIVYLVDTSGVWVQFTLPVAADETASNPQTQTGSVALVTGTKTISTATITANSVIQLTRQAQGGTLTTTLEYDLASITPGAPGSFVINASKADGTVNTGDTSTIGWLVVG